MKKKTRREKPNVLIAIVSVKENMIDLDYNNNENKRVNGDSSFSSANKMQFERIDHALTDIEIQQRV